MKSTIMEIAPEAIEAESFRIIAEELGPTEFDPRTFKVVQRVIHATGDFSFAESLVFYPQAIDAGIAAIRAGRNILTDVNMGAAGVSKGLLAAWGGSVICKVADPEVDRIAKESGLTRSEVAIEMGLTENIGIVSVGNAPTALLKVMECWDALAPELRPGLVVGVPVGFVNAAESKELLSEKTYPFITCLGRKGGTPVAVAIVNALIRLAKEV
ncbi:MAG: precorrin-8X methylmutase [Deltaproteobacteria bacterium]|uniref:precorrin-8X methylmutase n=1 Tax=Hydrosulfovibrio ferrireducens TaxID=2934181 RepID=UPI000CC429B2|nr:MAG: precorrin-8X methylmutase [Deltaproteobacteria bacterium HGW-Deltaproteobacteria-16]TDB30866.1 MAG: precorrin-8X methylmutase [Deltaproteobacteria bacterium]